MLVLDPAGRAKASDILKLLNDIKVPTIRPVGVLDTPSGSLENLQPAE